MELGSWLDAQLDGEDQVRLGLDATRLVDPRGGDQCRESEHPSFDRPAILPDERGGHRGGVVGASSFEERAHEQFERAHPQRGRLTRRVIGERELLDLTERRAAPPGQCSAEMPHATHRLARRERGATVGDLGLGGA